jgi:hypothetical protein
MDQVLNAVDLVVPPASMVMLAFAWPTLTFLRGVQWVLKTLTKEDMLGKVVVITGASSAIGEVYTYGVSFRTHCSLGLSATNQQYFSLRTNQPAVLFSQNKPAPAISHQPTEHAVDPTRIT